MCYKNDIGQTFYSMEALMCYVNYAKRAEASIYARAEKNRLNPPKVRKQAEKAAAAGKQCSKDLMHASNQSHEESDNPEEVSLPGELPKKVCHDKAPNSASASHDEEEAQFHLSKYYQ
ncbi:unnamed protein product [Camellia sinensis]